VRDCGFGCCDAPLPPTMWQCFKTLRRRRADLTLGVANKSQSVVNAAFCDGYHIASATAALSGVENVRILNSEISGSMASDRGAVTKASQRGKGRAVPEHGSSIAQPVVNRGWGIPGGGS
jgi:hypothetical protein